MKYKLVIQNKAFDHGFTLVEMAVVLVIVGLLLVGLLVPLSAQLDQRNYSESRKQLDEIKEALLGYALINRKFPCPAKRVTTTTDPLYGMEDLSMCGLDGMLPWKTLGVREVDSWGIPNDQVSPQWLGYWHYRVDANYSTVITSLSTSFSSNLLIKDAAGNALTLTTERPVAIVYSTGKNLRPDGENQNSATTGIYQSDTILPTYDDLTVWLSRPLLMNRMISSGQLP